MRSAGFEPASISTVYLKHTPLTARATTRISFIIYIKILKSLSCEYYGGLKNRVL